MLTLLRILQRSILQRCKSHHRVNKQKAQGVLEDNRSDRAAVLQTAESPIQIQTILLTLAVQRMLDLLSDRATTLCRTKSTRALSACWKKRWRP